MAFFKILVTESIKTGAIYKKQLYCAYDAYSVDCDGNRILKTTMEYLLRANIAGSRKKELKRLLLYFSEVTTVDRHGINWKLRYDRSNQTYRMLIGVCQLVLKGLLQTNRDGSVRIMDYLDDQTMPRLYEKFILNYFKREHPELKAYSPQIPWQLDDGLGELLPSMQSDIVLKNQNTQKTLIIDAKYYAHNTQAKAPYLSHTIHSGNLYQIFTYVKNWPTDDGQTVSGMLLYAGTDDAVQPHGDYAMSGNAIRVRTLDLNRDFSEIRAQLDEIAGLLT